MDVFDLYKAVLPVSCASDFSFIMDREEPVVMMMATAVWVYSITCSWETNQVAWINYRWCFPVLC